MRTLPAELVARVLDFADLDTLALLHAHGELPELATEAAISARMRARWPWLFSNSVSKADFDADAWVASLLQTRRRSSKRRSPAGGVADAVCGLIARAEAYVCLAGPLADRDLPAPGLLLPHERDRFVVESVAVVLANPARAVIDVTLSFRDAYTHAVGDVGLETDAVLERTVREILGVPGAVEVELDYESDPEPWVDDDYDDDALDEYLLGSLADEPRHEGEQYHPDDDSPADEPACSRSAE